MSASTSASMASNSAHAQRVRSPASVRETASGNPSSRAAAPLRPWRGISADRLRNDRRSASSSPRSCSDRRPSRARASAPQHRLIHREEIRAVDPLGGHAEAAGARLQYPSIRRRRRHRCARCSRCSRTRRWPGACRHHREIHRLEHRALVAATVTPERNTDTALARAACRRSPHQPPAAAPHPRWRLRPAFPLPTSAMCMEPPLPLHKSIPPTVDLLHHPADITTLGYAVTVTTMCAHDVVGVRQAARIHPLQPPPGRHTGA